MVDDDNDRTEADTSSVQLLPSNGAAPSCVASHPTMTGNSSSTDPLTISGDYCSMPSTPRTGTEETMPAYDPSQDLQLWPDYTPQVTSASNSGAAVQLESSTVTQQNSRIPDGTPNSESHPANGAASSHAVAHPTITGSSSLPVPSSIRGGGYCSTPSTSLAGIEEPEVACDARVACPTEGSPATTGGNPRADKSLECSVCQKVFATEEILKKHQFTQCGQTAHVCDDCGRIFASRRGIATHLQYCKPFKCDSCTKPFMTEALLQSHVCTGR
ncbi:hypothetical protein MTO96_024388 [Rhipicephalus appendiculatus]